MIDEIRIVSSTAPHATLVSGHVAEQCVQHNHHCVFAIMRDPRALKVDTVDNMVKIVRFEQTCKLCVH